MRGERVVRSTSAVNRMTSTGIVSRYALGSNRTGHWDDEMLATQPDERPGDGVLVQPEIGGQ